MINQISADERKREFYGVEGMVHVEHAEPGQFPGYIPTPKYMIKSETETEAKVKGPGIRQRTVELFKTLIPKR